MSQLETLKLNLIADWNVGCCEIPPPPEVNQQPQPGIRNNLYIRAFLKIPIWRFSHHLWCWLKYCLKGEDHGQQGLRRQPPQVSDRDPRCPRKQTLAIFFPALTLLRQSQWSGEQSTWESSWASGASVSTFYNILVTWISRPCIALNLGTV